MLIRRRIEDLSIDIAFLVLDVSADAVPPFCLVTHTKANRSDPIFKQLMLFDEIDDVEAHKMPILVLVGKEEPFVVATRIGVIL